MLLRGEHVYLRAVEPEDATKIMIWENNPENWRVSGTEALYSMHGILEYINSIQNFRQCGEQRLIICKKEDNTAIGTLDLFEASFKHGRAGIGILIAEKEERGKGYASESLNLLIDYSTKFLGFHNLFAHVLSDNKESIKLFENLGFRLVGIKKEWFYDHGKWIDERIYQLCLKK
jgi:diamine N-acetyltransferase